MPFKKGDFIEVIDQSVAPFPMRGEIVEIDDHPLKESYAKIRLESVALPVPERWVNLRLAHGITR